MPSDVTGLILAGGQSRRFASDKALAEVNGVPMIARVYEVLAPICSEVLVSVDVPERTYPLPGPARFIADRVPDAGPLSGLDAGLVEDMTPSLLVVACDLPAITGNALRNLIAARSHDTDAVVAVTPDGRRQPLCACYHRSIAPLVTEQLAEGRYAMHALLDRLTVREVIVPAETLRNVNAPSDLPSMKSE